MYFMGGDVHMKEKLQRTLTIFILSAFFLCLIANYLLQMYTAQTQMVTDSKMLFRQVGQVLQQNNEELQAVKDDIRESCLRNAKTAAHILNHHPTHITDVTELQKIVSLLEIDEIHIFNREGTIYSGSIPQYYGVSMYAGEQIGFFLPMLTDTSLSLCQDMTPNTAENKQMQYAAVWTEDKSCIVQIGIEPVRVMELTAKNELSYIFSLLTTGTGATLFAIDPKTNTILGSTLEQTVGLNTIKIGIPYDKMTNWGNGFFVTLDGTRTYAVFEQVDGLILGRICSLNNLYKNVRAGNMRLFSYLFVIFAVQWILLSKYLEKCFVKGVSEIKRSLRKISNGNLRERLAVHTTPEFTEISNHVNSMVQKLEGELWVDELTGLCSRRGFYIELESLFRPGAALNHTALFMIDSDDLKKTNDKYGHEVGDKYLVCIANALNALDIPDKIVARLSGDEFAILIPSVDSREELMTYYQHLLDIRDVTMLTLSVQEQIPLRFSIGMAIYDDDGDTYQMLLKQADMRMYNDKTNRKKRKPSMTTLK